MPLLSTERGLISVYEIGNPEKLKENGYSYAFHCKELDTDCYSKLSYPGNPNYRAFAVTGDIRYKEHTISYDEEKGYMIKEYPDSSFSSLEETVNFINQ